ALERYLAQKFLYKLRSKGSLLHNNIQNLLIALVLLSEIYTQDHDSKKESIVLQLQNSDTECLALQTTD
ncbi:1449_t:CDS:1, partial [Gigaspora margarita]